MMSAAHKITEIQPYRRGRAFLAWRQSVGRYCESIGARALLTHVDENRWLTWFESGVLAVDAVNAELMRISE